MLTSRHRNHLVPPRLVRRRHRAVFPLDPEQSACALYTAFRLSRRRRSESCVVLDTANSRVNVLADRSNLSVQTQILPGDYLFPRRPREISTFDRRSRLRADRAHETTGSEFLSKLFYCEYDRAGQQRYNHYQYLFLSQGSLHGTSFLPRTVNNIPPAIQPMIELSLLPAT